MSQLQCGNRHEQRDLAAMHGFLPMQWRLQGLVGFDPGLGLIHNDAKGLQALALDLIEPVRPQVDAFVLDLSSSAACSDRTG